MFIVYLNYGGSFHLVRDSRGVGKLFTGNQLKHFCKNNNWRYAN
jgi:hypothetical protein